MEEASFEYGELAAEPPLRPHVRCLWFLRTSGPAPAPQLVVPDGCLELVVNCGAPVQQRLEGCVLEQPVAMLMGEVRRPVLIQPTGRVDIVGVRFAPGGAGLFFDSPVTDLVDGAWPLDAVMGASDRRYLRHVLDEEDRRERLRHLQRWLLERLLAGARPDEMVRECVFAILRARGAIGMAELARATGFTERQMQRRFKASVGISAKSFAQVVRFRAVLGAVAAGTREWIDVALECGYYDQSHLIRDFRSFTGGTPLAYVSREHHLSEAFSSGWAELNRRAELLGRMRIRAAVN